MLTDVFLYAFVKEKHSHFVPSCYWNIQAPCTPYVSWSSRIPQRDKVLGNNTQSLIDKHKKHTVCTLISNTLVNCGWFLVHPLTL